MLTELRKRSSLLDVLFFIDTFSSKYILSQVVAAGSKIAKNSNNAITAKSHLVNIKLIKSGVGTEDKK